PPAPPPPSPPGPAAPAVMGVDRGAVERVLGELVPVAAVEYRGPEAAWAVPLAWRGLLVAHIRVSRDGGSIVPDPGLTAELRRLRLL
ncbi:MAG: hypothetical protein LRS49_04735, partial [Desulfurococcales archaeon]|nr:hypothetical protein [Desulfurococcales archaeon]